MELTRRQLLKNLAITPILGSLLDISCSSNNKFSSIKGGFVKTPIDIGHRLRTFDYEKLKKDLKPKEIDVVIVGGGISGLTSAWNFKRNGFSNYTLLEMDSNFGGTSQYGKNDISEYPWGAHYIPTPSKENKALIALLSEAKVVSKVDPNGTPIIAEEYILREPLERLFIDSKWEEGLYPVALSTKKDLQQYKSFHNDIKKFATHIGSDGKKAFAIPISQSTKDIDIQNLDKISMKDYLTQKGYDSKLLHWFVDYACRDDYGTYLEDTSAWAGIFYYAARYNEEEHSSEFITWPEGNGFLVKHLTKEVYSNIQKNIIVTSINPDVIYNGSKKIDIFAWNVEKEIIERYHANYLILSIPLFIAKYIIEPWRANPPSYIASFNHSPWLVANISLLAHPKSSGFYPSWDNVFYNSSSLGYVSATHQQLIDYGPTVFTYYYPFPGKNVKEEREKLLNTSFEKWVEIIISELEKAHPNIIDLITNIDIMRHGHAMIRPVPGLIWGGLREEAMKSFKGIHFAHTDLSGVALFEEALDNGLRASDEVLSEIGFKFNSMRGL